MRSHAERGNDHSAQALRLSEVSDKGFRLWLGKGLTNLSSSLPIQRPDLTVRLQKSKCANTDIGRFFTSEVSCRGSCARDTFGYAGFAPFGRSVNPRIAATLFRLTANRGSSIYKGASP